MMLWEDALTGVLDEMQQTEKTNSTVIRSDIYKDVQNMTFENLKTFHEKYIKDNTYVTVLVGSRDKIDFDALETYGKVKELSLDELFGYEDSEVIESM